MMTCCICTLQQTARTPTLQFKRSSFVLAAAAAASVLARRQGRIGGEGAAAISPMAEWLQFNQIVTI